MGLTDDDVQDRRMRRDHVGQRGERELVPLARTEQAEAQDDLAALDAQSRLDRDRIDEGKFGTPCGMTWSGPVDPVDARGDRPRTAT